MLEDLKDEEVVFTIDASDESKAYDVYGDPGPVSPWAAKVQITPHGAVRLVRYDFQTGTTDDDSNASTHSPRHVFRSVAEAAAAYVVERRRHAARRLAEALEFVDRDDVRSLVQTGIELLEDRPPEPEEREPGSLGAARLDLIGRLHDWLLRESPLYQTAHELGQTGLMAHLQLTNLNTFLLEEARCSTSKR